MENISYNQEICRKLIHLSSLWIPLCIWNLQPFHVQIILLSVFAGIIIFEIIRRRDFINISLLEDILRPSEKTVGHMRPTGAFYMLAAAIITAFVMPKEIAAASLTVLMISDSCAALAGRKWGKHKIMQKSLEGSMSFLLSAFIISAFFAFLLENTYNHKIFFLSGCIAGFIAALCELFTKQLKIDDNFIIPLSFAFTQLYFITVLQ